MRVNNSEKIYFPLLDFARYLAALSILIWHYQHFYFISPKEFIFDWNQQNQPFFSALQLFYKYGYQAVPFFWMLSGYTLAVNYMSTKFEFFKFWVYRFSRLYPLHILTLVILAFAQFLSYFLLGHFQIYPSNRIRDFFLNLFFINNGNMFNGPIWSLSVELFVYLIFSILLFRKVVMSKPNILFIVIIAFFFQSLIGFFHFHFHLSVFVHVPEATFCFFLGVLAYKLHLDFNSRFLFTFALCLLPFGFAFWRLNSRIEMFFLALLLIIASIEKKFVFSNIFEKRAQFFGNQTYALYLIHIPFQVFILIFREYFYPNHESFANNQLFFVGYIVFLNFVAFYVFTYFEKPLRKKLQLSIRF